MLKPSGGVSKNLLPGTAQVPLECKPLHISPSRTLSKRPGDQASH